MDAKTVPWWRKALNYALGGIRSGFGLFSRTEKNKTEDEPERFAGQEENPEEDAELTEHISKLEPIADEAHETKAVTVPEAAVAAEPVPEAQVAATHEPVLPDSAPQAVTEVESISEALAVHETDAEAAMEEIIAEETAPIESHAQAAAEQESTDWPVAARTEPAEQVPAEPIAEVANTPETEVAPAPAPEGQLVAASDSAVEFASPAEPLAEPVAASVELTEPVMEQIPDQPAEIESLPEVVASAEAESELPHEPVNPPINELESIPEQTDEPVRQDAAGETSPDSESAVEEAAPADTPSLEAAVEPVEAAEPPAAEPGIEEPAVEVAPAVEPVDSMSEPADEPVDEPAVNPSDVPAAAAPMQASAPVSAPPAKPFIKLETRDNAADLSPFSVVVAQVYDGPLDLLLDLIRKQDIDIYDIPIARITSQFLAYVNQLKATDVDVAGEFIYTASLLIHIKSKMLLPRAPSGPDDAAEDPRRELVERLLEHERFKNAAQMLQQKQMLEAATWTNPGLREFQDDASAEPEIAADTVDLVRIFRDILDRARNRPVINVQEDSVTVGQMIQFLARRLTMEDKPVALRRLLSHTRSERALIAMFLALLELVRLQAILLRQDLAFSEIFIKKNVGFENVMNDGLASARDDWR